MRLRLLLLILIYSPLAAAQGFSVVNFSQGVAGTTPTQAQLLASQYGTVGSGSDVAFGCTLGVATCNFHLSNSSGALTIQNQSASVCNSGTVPPNSGGPNAKILDYSTTLASGIANQDILINYPASQSTVTEGSVWFCSNIPVTANFGTTFDAVIVIGPASRISNYLSNNTATQGFAIESNGQAHIPYTPGNWVQVVWQQVNNGACSDLVNFTDCTRLRLYDINGNLLGDQYDTTGGPGPSDYLTLGNLNAITYPVGNYHVQYMNPKVCTLGCSPSQFPVLQYPSPLWDGIVTPGRASDFTKAGPPSQQLPNASWTQCGSTLAAGTYAGATLTATMAACSANQFYKLGPGTFTLTGLTKIPPKVELRGSGSNSTFLTVSGPATTCNQTGSVLCMVSSDGTFTTQPPPNTCTVTSGLTQGSTSITLANLAGTCLTGISTSNPTLLLLDWCNTGLSGASCGTGTMVDNSQWYVCDLRYTATPTGCAIDGPDTGGSRNLRDELEVHTATAINTGTGVATITPPILSANAAVQSNPQVWIVQPSVQPGITNLSIDPSGYSNQGNCIDMFNLYQFFIANVRCVNAAIRGFNCLQCANGIIQSNYIYNVTGTPPSQYGIRMSATSLNIIENNIIQQVLSPIFLDGASSGNVIANNFIINNISPSHTLSPAITAHAGNYGDLIEGNVANSFSCDDIHGTCDAETAYRNFLSGWESQPTNTQTVFTNAFSIWAFARYSNLLANVIGTSGYHTGYSAFKTNGDVYWMGGGGTTGGTGITIPNDSLTTGTAVIFGNYDTFTSAVRFCGSPVDTGWSSPCSSTTESSPTASTYPGFVPSKGDTAVGQDAFPASLYRTVRPSWWSNSIPFPAVGPDISSGNVGACGGTINTVGQFAKVAATNASQCASQGLNTAWASHVNAIPAMNCALNTMGMPVDGSGSALTFDAVGCYVGGVAVSTPTFSPLSGNFTTTFTVTISCATAGATITYTTDGSTPIPGSHGTVYAGPFQVTASQFVQAIGSLAGSANSAVGQASYQLGPGPVPGMFAMFGPVSGKSVGATMCKPTPGETECCLAGDGLYCSWNGAPFKRMISSVAITTQ